jgi:hypothetical protein
MTQDSGSANRYFFHSGAENGNRDIGQYQPNVQHPLLYITITDGHQRQNISFGAHLFLLDFRPGLQPSSIPKKNLL